MPKTYCSSIQEEEGVCGDKSTSCCCCFIVTVFGRRFVGNYPMYFQKSLHVNQVYNELKTLTVVEVELNLLALTPGRKLPVCVKVTHKTQFVQQFSKQLYTIQAVYYEVSTCFKVCFQAFTVGPHYALPSFLFVCVRVCVLLSATECPFVRAAQRPCYWQLTWWEGERAEEDWLDG